MLLFTQVLCSKNCWAAAQVANIKGDPDTLLAISTGQHKLKGVAGMVSVAGSMMSAAVRLSLNGYWLVIGYPPGVLNYHQIGQI